MPAPLPAWATGAAAKMSVPVSTDRRPAPRVRGPRPGLRPRAARCRSNATGTTRLGFAPLGPLRPGDGGSLGASPPNRSLCLCLSFCPFPGEPGLWGSCCSPEPPPSPAGTPLQDAGPVIGEVCCSSGIAVLLFSRDLTRMARRGAGSVPLPRHLSTMTAGPGGMLCQSPRTADALTFRGSF